MTESGSGADVLIWLAATVAILVIAAGALVWFKGRKLPGPHVFRASRFSRGNLLFPKQVAITPASVVYYTPELVGGREHSMHIAHVASVQIDRNLFFADIVIETSGGTSPVRCYGHRKAEAQEIKRLIEQFQSDYYRTRGRPEATPAS